MGKLGPKPIATALITGGILFGIEVAWRVLGLEQKLRRALGI